jgi:hypothetical protein
MKPAPNLLLARVKAYCLKYIYLFISSYIEIALGFYIINGIKTSILNCMHTLIGGGVF